MSITHLISIFAPVFTYPLGFSLVLMVIGVFVALITKEKLWGFGCILLGVVIVYGFSTNVVAQMLVHNLEKQYAPQKSYPHVSAILLLGGAGVGPEAPRIYPETNDFGDRIFHAARLYKQKCSNLIITSGGYHDWRGKEGLTEAEINASLLVELLGVNAGDVICETKSENTANHGPTIGKILDSLGLSRNVLVVTSAVHMKRSMAVFKKNGYTPIAAPTDFRFSNVIARSVADFFPSSSSLNESHMALHEYYGLVTYKILGWI